jgi:two-component system, NarL family, sensor kinase
MKKRYTLFCLMGLIALAFWVCNTREETISKNEVDSPKEHWLRSKQNFESSPAHYRKEFWQYYEEIKTNNDLKKRALGIFGEVLMDAYATDSMYTKVLLDYISEENTEPDSLWIALHYYAVDQLYSVREYTKLNETAAMGLALCTSPTHDNLKVGMITLIGLGYSDRSKPDSAIACFLEASKLAEKNNFTRKLGSIYNNLAWAYDMLYASNESAKYYEKAAEKFLEAKDTSNYFALLTTYAINQLYFTKDTLKTLSLFDSAFVQYNKLQQISPFDSSNANEILAYKFFYLGDYDLAKKYNDKCIDYRLKVGTDDYLLTYNYIFDSDIYYNKNGKLKDKAKTLQWAGEMRTNEQYYDALELYDQLYEDAKNNGDFEKAAEYLLISNTLNDSISINNQKGQIFELEKKFQTQKKEQEIILQKSELAKKNFLIALLVAVLGVLLLTSLVFYFWNRQKSLKQEKENSMNFTKQLLQNTEEERKRIAGDLHDSISHELLNLKTIFTEDMANVNTKIDTIINDIRGISRNLHPVMFDKIGLVPNIEQLLERAQNQHKLFVTADINYTGSLKSADELQVYRILQEAITNIIKYSHAHAAKIAIDETANSIAIEIKDNGTGFDVKKALNSGKAFGLHNIIERSRVIGGEAHITSGKEGTTISIIIEK